jgi:hypothetical protein
MLFSPWGNLHSACIAMLSFQGWGEKLQDFVESIWPIRKATREWPLFALTGRLESTSSYVRDKRGPRLSPFFLPDNRMKP